MELIEILSY